MNDDDDFLTGKESEQARAGFEPMAPDPRLPQDEPDDKPVHGSDRDSMIKAANELHASRTPERDIVDREYRIIGGEHDGEKTPPNRTLDIDRAADDLRAARDAEVQAIENAENEHLTKVLDEVVGIATPSEIDSWIEQQKAQLHAQQQEALTQNPPPPPPGADPELYDLLMRHPVAAKALQNEVDGIARAQQAFANASEQNARVLAAALVNDVEELRGLDSSQYGLALELISRSNPQKAEAIRQRFGKIEELYRVSQQARQQQVQLEAQKASAQQQAWLSQESQKWDKWAAEPANKQRISTVMPQAFNVFSEAYGLSRQEVMHLQKTQPLLSTKLGQEILLDAISYQAAKRTATQNPARAPLPPVQKPGVAPPSYRPDDGEVSEARSRFLSSPSAKSAAKFIAARRRAS